MSAFCSRSFSPRNPLARSVLNLGYFQDCSPGSPSIFPRNPIQDTKAPLNLYRHHFKILCIIFKVYAIILEFLATLDKTDRDKIEYILYGKIPLMVILFLKSIPALDDMCHLAPYGKNVLKKNKTELTEFFNSRKLAVDFLHFKVIYFFILWIL